LGYGVLCVQYLNIYN